MPPLKMSRPVCQPAVYCLTDVAGRCGGGSGAGAGTDGGVAGGAGAGLGCGGSAGAGVGDGPKRTRNRRLLLTPYGIFLGDDGAVLVVASPGAVAAVTAAAATGNRDPPIAHAVISEWTQLEFEVRAGLRESPLSSLDGMEAAARATARPEAAAAAEVRTTAPTPAPSASSSTALQVMPMGPGRFLLFVQGFATIMSTIMLIRKAVDASMFESLQT